MKRSGLAVLAAAAVLLLTGTPFIPALLSAFFAVWLVGMLGPRSFIERAGALVAAGWLACAWTGRGGYVGAACVWFLTGLVIAWVLRPRADPA